MRIMYLMSIKLGFIMKYNIDFYGIIKIYLFSFFLIFSIYVFAGVNNKEYCLLIDPEYLGQLEVDDIFVTVQGKSNDTIDELINVIKTVTANDESYYCIINSQCFTKTMDEWKISDDVEEVKYISGQWLSLPAYILLLYECSCFQNDNKGYDQTFNDPKKNDSVLYNKFLRNRNDRHKLDKAICSMCTGGIHYTRNRMDIIKSLGDALESRNSDKAKLYFCPSPFDNDPINSYRKALKKNRSSQVKNVSNDSNNENFSMSLENDAPEKSDVGVRDDQYKELAVAYLNEVSKKFIIRCKCEQKISEPQCNMSSASNHRTIVNNDNISSQGDEESLAMKYLKRQTKNRTKCLYCTKISTKDVAIKEWEKLFKLNILKNVFFLTGEFSMYYHPDIMINHLDISLIFDKRAIVENIFAHSQYSQDFIFTRCIHYDRLKAKIITAVDGHKGYPFDIEKMLKEMKFLPKCFYNFSVSQMLYKKTCFLRNKDIFKIPDIQRSSFFDFLYRVTRCNYSCYILSEKKLVKLKDSNSLTFSLGGVLFLNKIEETRKKEKLCKSKQVLLVSGRYYEDVTPDPNNWMDEDNDLEEDDGVRHDCHVWAFLNRVGLLNLDYPFSTNMLRTDDYSTIELDDVRLDECVSALSCRNELKFYMPVMDKGNSVRKAFDMNMRSPEPNIIEIALGKEKLKGLPLMNGVGKGNSSKGQLGNVKSLFGN